MILDTADEFMLAAIDEARAGLAEGGIPIGAVLVRNGTILSRGRNRRVQSGNPMMHAEIDCLVRAGRIGSYRGCTLYTTLFPCYLCAGAIVQFGIERVVVGDSSSFKGASDLLQDKWVQVIELEDETCRQLMAEFMARQPDLWKEDIGKL